MSRAAMQQAQPVAWVECDGELVWSDYKAAIGRNLYTTPPAPVVPPGWKLVPVEPTQEMCKAAIYNTNADCDGDWAATVGNYRAMLTAAPEAPVPVVPQPLTDADVNAMWGAVVTSEGGLTTYDYMLKLARAVEAEVLKCMGAQR